MEYLNPLFKHVHPLKIDLGSGISPKEGCIGIDNFIGIKAQSLSPDLVDVSKLTNVIQHNLDHGIPFEHESVDEIATSHFLEHVNNLDFIFEECYRVLRKNRTLNIWVPYANSAEGMYPGHNIFFTEKWFLRNMTFNKLFKIQKIIFYESDYYATYRKKINKLFDFSEAKLFLFNCCWQMQIVSTRRMNEADTLDKNTDVEFINIPWKSTCKKKVFPGYGRIYSYLGRLLKNIRK